VSAESPVQDDAVRRRSEEAFLARLQQAADEATAPLKPPPLGSIINELFKILAGKSQGTSKTLG
jgi:hypothetical protein